jgi:integrase/recombinase XerC
VLYQTGMESRALWYDFENVNLSGNELKIIGKGNKERYIPISGELSDLLKSYLKIRKPLTEYDYIFLSIRKAKNSLKNLFMW